MRTRLLADPAALADYELVEMLLFLGIPRRDTKPQAKGLLNRFGSLAATLRSGAVADVPEPVVAAFDLVVQAAGSLARADAAPRPKLGDWEALDRYLSRPGRAGQEPGLSVLMLDSRNQLLGEPRWGNDVRRDDDDGGGAWQQDVLRKAVLAHAAALIVVRNLGRAKPAVGREDRRRHATLQREADALGIRVHDTVVAGDGAWVSLAQART